MKLSVILPAHNEAPNIRAMVQGLLQRYAAHILEIIVVDDASTDDTAEAVRGLARTEPRVRLVRRRPPCGVGRALKAGFKAVDAAADHVLMMDSDFLENLGDVQLMLDKIAEGYDGVVGSRFVGGTRLVNYPGPKLVANRAFHALARLLLGIRQHDLTNNFKLYRVEIIKSIRWRNDTFAINAETGLLPLLHHFRIAEVPVMWIQRSKSMGLSNFKILRVGPQYTLVLLQACAMRMMHLWRAMLNPAPHPRAVKRHYEQLAAQYTIRANPYCATLYQQLARHWLGAQQRLLEVGCGTMPVIAELPAPSKVGVDFSEMMLRHRTDRHTVRCAASDALTLPFAGRVFDGVLSINLIEHVRQPRALLRECARVLRPGGRLLLVTPNGDWSGLLELAELLRLKLPEGPHQFITTRRLRDLVADAGLTLLAQECVALLPVRPMAVAAWAERVRQRWCPRAGLFQYVVAQQPG